MFMAKARLKLVTPTILRSFLGTTEAPGDVLGDTVTFGASATAGLIVGTGAEAGLTAGTNHIGQTNVLGAAAGMEIEFFFDVTRSSAIANERRGNGEEPHGGGERSRRRAGRSGRGLLQLPRQRVLHCDQHRRNVGQHR
jgi:hypothetical protein